MNLVVEGYQQEARPSEVRRAPDAIEPEATSGSLPKFTIPV